MNLYLLILDKFCLNAIQSSYHKPETQEDPFRYYTRYKDRSILFKIRFNLPDLTETAMKA